jgi:hypothetical protein
MLIFLLLNYNTFPVTVISVPILFLVPEIFQAIMIDSLELEEEERETFILLRVFKMCAVCVLIILHQYKIQKYLATMIIEK